MTVPTRELTLEEKNELNGLGILQLAETLHEHCNGASDHMDPDRFIQACSWITYKLSEWYPAGGRRSSISYDNGVWLICTAVLDEVEHWLVDNEKYITYKNNKLEY